MEIKYRSNFWTGIISCIIGGVIYATIPYQIGVDFNATYGINSRSVPYAAAVILILLGAFLLFKSLVMKKDKEKTMNLKQEGKAAGYMVILIAYCFLFKYSFVVSTGLLGLLTLYLTGSKKKLYYVIVLATVIMLYLVFTRLLNVRLP